MASSLKQKTIVGMIWNGTERFGSSLFLFVTNLVLARLLSPDDFGCIGMLLVFISVSEAIVDGGFGSALIQKKEPTQIDYSTVFHWNIVLSISLYIVLYFSAPLIANFYDIPLLSAVLRIQGCILIINAFSLIQRNILRKQVAFKKIAKINLSAIVIGTIVGIISAFWGCGVWGLVIKSLVTGVIQCVAYWIFNNWRPSWAFSWVSFTSLFRFGSFIFCTVIINTIYHNLLSLILGKNFSAATLGYYTQARKLEEIPRSGISSMVSSVSFPVFSQIQDDVIRLSNAVRKCLKSLMVINIPMALLLMMIAKPLIILLFTSKWESSIPYFQVLCIYGLFTSPIDLNREVLHSVGKSKISFNIMVVHRALGILLIVAGLSWGIKGLLIGFVISQLVGYIIYAIMSGRLIGYGLIKQCKDTLPILSISVVAAIATLLLSTLLHSTHIIFTLAIQCVGYCGVYLTLAFLFKVEGFEPYYNLLKIKSNEN